MGWGGAQLFVAGVRVRGVAPPIQREASRPSAVKSARAFEPSNCTWCLARDENGVQVEESRVVFVIGLEWFFVGSV